MSNHAYNTRLIEIYGQLERLCNQIYNEQHGVSLYIEELWQNGLSHTQTYRTLKQIRHKRNQLSHGEIPFEYACATEQDIEFLITLRAQILAQTDPLSTKRAYPKSQRQTHANSARNRKYCNQKSQGCYIATCVYGSYDCPQVWILRRYRDYQLAETWYGRTFIRLYYAISPTLVRWFGKTKWFKKIWKNRLDKMVRKLEKRGFIDTPYADQSW